MKESDPALDAWLAEHVMGWTWAKKTQTNRYDDGKEVTMDYYGWEDAEGNPHHGYSTGPDAEDPTKNDFSFWSPSSRPEQALEVAEKTQAHILLKSTLALNADEAWVAEIGGHPWKDACPARRYGSTPALALCRAAKAWKEAQA